MTLPRFTSGRVGNLEFQHLNEAFDRIDALGSAPERLSFKGEVFHRVILVKVTGVNGTGATATGSFVEVALATVPSQTYTPISGGITSASGANTYAFPIVAPVPPVDAIVPVVAHISNDGKLYFVQAVAPSTLQMLRILSSTATTGTQWRYDVQPVRWSAGWVDDGLVAYGYNGCEFVGDIAASRTIGTGTIHPDTADAVRKPLRNNLVVGPALKQGTDWVFSIPNGYEFTCI